MEPPFFMPEEMAQTLKNAPIGVFDSGIGGLTVLKALEKALPQESFVYIADAAHSPYGTKGADLVYGFAQQLSVFLKNWPVKAIVVACNTASAVLKQRPLQGINVPVFEVITPTAQSVTGQHVAAIATATTIRSGAYEKALAENGKQLEWAKPTPMLVPLVEEGLSHDPIAHVLLKHYLTDLPQNIDTLILGCTHYPVLKPQIQALLPNVALVDAADATAKTVATTLGAMNLLAASGQGEHTVFTTGDAKVFNQLAEIAGFDVVDAKKLDLSAELPEKSNVTELKA